jgi:hypothetical protein
MKTHTDGRHDITALCGLHETPERPWKAAFGTYYKNEWCFSIVDVCSVLTQSPDSGACRRKLQQRINEEESEVVTFCHGLKMTAFEKGLRQTDEEKDEVEPVQSDLMLYQTEDGQTRIEVRLKDETVRMSQKLMAELFQTAVPNINMHISNIFEEGELASDSVIKDFLTTAADGKNWV